MKSQLNPAWQRKTVSSDRLAKVSTRFLSDGPQPEHQTDSCQVIPFLLDDPSQSWITHDLCQVLNQRGHNSLLCHVDDENEQRPGPMPASGLINKTADAEYCLIPLTNPSSVLEMQLSHVVLLVPANLDAVLKAYQHIKLLSRYKAPEIGIVMVGPRDQHSAWRFFRKLAVGALRYLDVPLLNLGFLPEQVTPEHGPSDHHRHNFLARISERLMRSGFHSQHTFETSDNGAPTE